MRIARVIGLSDEQRARLLRVAQSQTASVRLTRRCGIVQLTTQSTPEAATHWSTRLAKVVGVSDTMVHRVWRKHGLKPHLVRYLRRRACKAFPLATKIACLA